MLLYLTLKYIQLPPTASLLISCLKYFNKFIITVPILILFQMSILVKLGRIIFLSNHVSSSLIILYKRPRIYFLSLTFSLFFFTLLSFCFSHVAFCLCACHKPDTHRDCRQLTPGHFNSLIKCNILKEKFQEHLTINFK